jgi:hypothetical protein
MADTPFGKFPYQFAQHIKRQYWDGVQPNHRTALVVDSRAVSDDKETLELLRRHGFRHHGRKWYRIDEPCSALSESERQMRRFCAGDAAIPRTVEFAAKYLWETKNAVERVATRHAGRAT